MRKIIICALIFTIFAIQKSALAAMSAREIVERAYASEKNATFQGVMLTSVLVNGKLVSAKVKVYRSRGKTRMEYLTGPAAGTVIIENNNSVTTIPAKETPQRTCLQYRASNYLDQLLENYTPKLAGSQSIASRNCYVIKLEPRFSGNPASKIWVDKGNYVILKIDRYASNGKLVSLSQYANIDFSAKPPDFLFRAPTNAGKLSARKSLEDVHKEVGFTPLKPKYIPKGYSFEGYYTKAMPCGLSFVALKYVNGLNTISVFESKCPCRGASCISKGHGRRAGRCGGSAPGACMLADRPQARMFYSKVGDITIVVVGDAPTSELKKITESIK